MDIEVVTVEGYPNLFKDVKTNIVIAIADNSQAYTAIAKFENGVFNSLSEEDQKKANRMGLKVDIYSNFLPKTSTSITKKNDPVTVVPMLPMLPKTTTSITKKNDPVTEVPMLPFF